MLVACCQYPKSSHHYILCQYDKSSRVKMSQPPSAAWSLQLFSFFLAK
jgi:hypothetical protein